MALSKITADSLGANAVTANSIGYTPANKAGDTFTGATTFSANVILGTTTISANGGVGTSGQVLTSGATGNAYWSTVSTTLDSVLGSGNTTTKSLTTGPLTVNGAFTTSTNTATFGTSVYHVANGNVGIGTNTPGAILDTYIGTGLTTLGDFSNSVRINGGNDVNKYVPITFGGYGSYAPAAIGYQVTTGTGNTYGDLVFATRNVSTDTRPTERTRIESSGNHLFKTKKVGMGTYTGNGKETQMLSWSGTSTNGTIDLLTNTSFGENGHCGMFFLNVTTAGKGVTRIYFMTGRYGQCQLTMYQGGNRGAGEDAYLQLAGGTNTIGLQLVLSGWSGSQPYFVSGWVGLTTTYYDNWFSN